MLRRLFTVVSALSLLLCVATVAVWVWSCFHYDSVGRWVMRPDRKTVTGHVAASSNGRLLLGRMVFRGDAAGDAAAGTQTWRSSTADGSVAGDPGGSFNQVAWGSYSRVYSSYDLANGIEESTLVVRLWPVAALTAFLPLLWVGRAVARRRLRRLQLHAGLCLRCGYDLRATPGRCPECGAVSPAKKT